MVSDRKRIKVLRENFLEGIGVPEQVTFKPDQFQQRAIESLLLGNDTLVVAPTGTGKTYIAIEAIKQVLASGKRAIYTAPLKALSNTKYAEFKVLFAPDYSVGLLTGDRKIDTDSSLVVATTEIYRNELYNVRNDNYGLVVLDEVHYLADPQRGPVWEESIILSSKASTLLMLSASISNSKEIAEWISEVRGKEINIISETKRPVELRLGFLHPEYGIIPIEENGSITEEVLRYYQEGKYSEDRGGRGHGRRNWGDRSSRRGRSGGGGRKGYRGRRGGGK